MDLQSALRDVLSDNVVSKIAKSTGATNQQVEQVIDLGLPTILGKLAQNTTNQAGAKALDAAVAKDHTGGSLMESLSGMFDGGNRNDEGQKILSHVFGDTSSAEKAISKKSGIDPSMVALILSFLAPLVMAQLGKQKSSGGLDMGGLGDLLQKQTDSKGNILMDVATAVLDKNRDGSMLDDIFGMFQK